jgi:hypothetical protein
MARKKLDSFHAVVKTSAPWSVLAVILPLNGGIARDAPDVPVDAMPSLDPAALEALKARHLTFFEARVVSAKAEAEWQENLAAVYRDLLAARLSDVASAGVLADAANALFTSQTIEGAVRPLARQILREALRELRVEKGRVGDRVPAEGRQRIMALLERPGLMPDRFLREIIKEDAIDEVMRDVLYDALKEFSEKVNPFFADWGLPALLKKLGPFGFGKGLESLRADFDRRLEPEMRKFLQGFSKKSLRRMVDFIIEHGDEPKFIAVRKRLAGWLLGQEVADLARATDIEAVLLGQDITLDIAAAELERSDVRARRRAALEQAIAAFQHRTVGEVLAELGVTFTPDFGPIAAATWPLARAALASPAAKAWFSSLVEEFYDAEIAALASVPEAPP